MIVIEAQLANRQQMIRVLNKEKQEVQVAVSFYYFCVFDILQWMAVVRSIRYKNHACRNMIIIAKHSAVSTREFQKQHPFSALAYSVNWLSE